MAQPARRRLIRFAIATKSRSRIVWHRLSFGVLVGTLANALPAIAALMTIVWTLIRIWETDTVKRLTGRKD